MFLCIYLREEHLGAFVIAAGWWGHQPGYPPLGGVTTAYNQPGYATI